MPSEPIFRRAIDELASDGPACIHLEALPRFLSEPQNAAPRRSLPKVKGKLAIVPLQGVMSRRGYYGVSTVAVGRALEAAAQSADVSAILLEIDSPGGSAYGTPELGAIIDEVKQAKPIVGIADSMAASAAMWAGSATSRFVVTPSGDVGSIGAFILHASMKRVYEEFGIDINIIRSVPGKADANPYEALTEDARKALEASVAVCHAEFVATVAKNRGKSQAYVEENFGKGRLVPAKDALKVGMVDRVATTDEVIREMVAKSGTGPKAQGAETSIVAAFLGVDPEKVAFDVELRRKREERQKVGVA